MMDYVDDNRDRFLDELLEFLSIPSISTDPEMADEVERCAEWLRDHFEQIGMPTAEIHETDGHPIVYSEYTPYEDEDVPTILLYAHYDVQPPDPLDEWDSPPFEPTIRDEKIFARGATDDKGQFFCHVKGLEAHLAERGELPCNVKVLVEGEEEVGSVNLAPWVGDHTDKLACDAVVISDSPMFKPGLPSITYGLRGLAYFEIDVEGPDHDLHSGLYGGAVANPINVLSDMIGQLHDDDGRIAIPGFYDDVQPVTDAEREAFADLPFDEDEFLASVGAERLSGEAGYTTLERRWVRPTLDCNGIWGGYTEEGAKTVLPAEASAKISCRLVPDQDPDDIVDKAEQFLRDIAPDSVRVNVEPHHGGQPVVSDRDTPTMHAAKRALKRSWNEEAVFTRGGGTIPVVPIFADKLDAQAVLMGYGLDDDRLHSPNEKFNLENFHRGVDTSTYLWDEITS